MTEAAAAIGMFNGLRSWLRDRRQEDAALGREEKQAIRALYVAANETRLYFNRIERPRFSRAGKNREPFGRNIEAEEELSRLWLEASVEVREFSPNLAMRCFEKAGYWSDPEQWTDEEIKRANISLNGMLESAKKLIGNT